MKSETLDTQIAEFMESFRPRAREFRLSGRYVRTDYVCSPSKTTAHTGPKNAKCVIRNVICPAKRFGIDPFFGFGNVIRRAADDICDNENERALRAQMLSAMGENQ